MFSFLLFFSFLFLFIFLFSYFHSFVCVIFLQTHPNIDKNRFTKENILALKNPGRPLPTGTPLGVLKYRLVSDREEDLPLSGSHFFSFLFFPPSFSFLIPFLLATCWPTPNGDGTTTCIVECETQQSHLQINYIEVHVPTGFVLSLFPPLFFPCPPS